MLGRIALDLTKDRNHQLRLEATVQLAAKHKAELVGIYSSPVTNQYLRDDTVVPNEVATLMRNYVSGEAAEIRDNFTRMAALAGIKASYRAPQGPTEEVLALHSRYCDLLVMSQAGSVDGPSYSLRPSLTEAVITSAGRPVLVIPYIGHLNPIGRRVLFCWDNGRRAARALADAAPILHEASNLIVLKVDENLAQIQAQDITPQDLNAYCASKGYPAPEVIKKESLNYGIGNTILNAATDQGCDLIVMGAYNRSRVREWVLGGTSKTLLQSMTVPILFSH
jgi:nucleotide-binding universal stress UspA family protein